LSSSDSSAGFTRRISALSAKAVRRVRRFAYGPRIPVAECDGLTFLGSSYGGWHFANRSALRNSLIVSCGLGEDATFDVEFASRFHARVILVDPTPRAIAHFAFIVERLGQAAVSQYSTTGTQPVDAYDLTTVADGQLELVPLAVTAANGNVQFFAPKNPADVSYSVVNFQNDYSRTTPHIEVTGITFPDLIANLPSGDVELVKFDIEGAEIAVIPQMLEAGITPTQVLVEYDELNRPSRRACSNFRFVHGLLLGHGYLPIHFDGRSCVSYLR
jgi:FkbM family methyltransferase